MQTDQIPDEALFFISDGYYGVNQVLHAIYGYPSDRTRKHFLEVNAHLKDRIEPGQMVIITPPDTTTCQQWETAMQVAARQVDAELAKMAEQERKSLAHNYALLSNVTTYTSSMYGWANNYFARRADLVKKVLQQIDNLYVSTYRRHGHLKTDHFFSQRKLLFLQLDQAMNDMMRRELVGIPAASASLKSQLGISTKATVHQWKMQGHADNIKGFENNYQQLTRTAKIFSRLGYVSIGLEVVGGVANIQQACAFDPESDRCMRARFSQPPKVVGSVIGGAIGGRLAAYGTCSLVFGLESAGTSFLWCSVVAGAAGGYAGAKTLGTAGEWASNEIYTRASSQ